MPTILFLFSFFNGASAAATPATHTWTAVAAVAGTWAAQSAAGGSWSAVVAPATTWTAEAVLED